MIDPRKERQLASILTRVREFIVGEKIDAYLVGGYVRDSLLGRPTRDIDIAVAAAAPEVAERLATALKARYVALDEANEIARVVVIEDDTSSAARWHLDFSTIRTSIEENLSNRDFTINAISVDLRDLDSVCTACCIDPFHGRSDLEERLVRAVSETAFESDPARLLRAVRLAAEYGFTVEEHTEALIRSQSHLIRRVAGERLREELRRLLSVRNSAHYLYYLDHLGLLTAMIPELTLTKGVEQPVEHYWDVFQHSIETVAALERLLYGWESGEQDPVLALLPRIPDFTQHFEEEVSSGVARAVLSKIAALLHDIAKPHTKSVDPNGRTRFLGHTKEGAAITGRILRRLRFSTRETKMVQSMVESHLRMWQMGGDDRPTHRAIYRFFRDTGDVSLDIILLTLADYLAARGPHLKLEPWEKHCNMMDYVWFEHEKEQARVVPSKLVDGHDLINAFGLQPGPRIGELLEALREAQGIGEIKTREEAIAYARRQLDREKTE